MTRLSIHNWRPQYRRQPSSLGRGISIRVQRTGLTLIELVLYLALSGVIIVTMVSFLGGMISARSVIAAQTNVQEQTRSVMERMTIAIRHAYRVEISGATLTIWSHPVGQTSTVYTVFQKTDQQLATGSGPVREAIQLESLLPNTINVTDFSATHISSAVEIQLTLEQQARTSRLQSIIAYRQTP